MSELPFRRLRVPRPQTTFADRAMTLRHRWRLILRISIATGGAFAVATYILGHQQAFFAPIAAVLALTAGVGMRVRVTFELVLGVAVGVFIGELLILGIGRGAWQIALVAALTAAIATLLGIKGMAMTQAINSGLLLAAVVPLPGASDPALTRFLDALVGGLFGLAMVVLIPRNPVRDIDGDVQRLLRRLGGVLSRVAQALRTDDAALADLALEEARAAQSLVDSVSDTATNVAEVARMSPMRWRQRDDVARYVDSVTDLDNAVRDARVLARRVAAMLRHDESAPAGLDEAIDRLVVAVGIFADDLAQSDEFDEAREELVEASRIAMSSLPEIVTVNTASIAAQIRSLSADLMLASGATRAELDERLDFD
ncbi:hypothetical protein D9V41_10215 [Aeromicrobium phragmitis]|uniref:Integral membrane bound transporter domain-containing protein n=1 Tax=Aeromicrobium phragmitis TaxID=2478914 RepID=A0A3L8PLY5_9ACTN|nr:FUSC family protein [Aeromicrobium phragmitis]RLV55819.1 hypothetical protein D9V41_10215 [Aeromicrobium phragmitis]